MLQPTCTCITYFDLWIEAWCQKVAKGDVIVVRYADDLVVGFENRMEAERSPEALQSTSSRTSSPKVASS